MADIAVILIIGLCTFLGYTRGLIKVAVRFISFILALVIALVLYTPISNYIIENTEIVPSLKSSIESKIYSKEEKEEKDTENQNIVDTMQGYVDNYTEGVKQSTSSFISQELALVVVRVGTWIGLFVVSKIILLFLKLFADAIGNVPIIKQFNKARRNSIWLVRRISHNICTSCGNRTYGTYNWRKCII